MVDNDVNMDFTSPAPHAEPRASPEVSFASPAPHADPRASPEVSMTEPPQPTSTDILHSIEALSKKFDDMLRSSGDRAEALHVQMETRVDALDEQWARKFAVMEAKLREVELRGTVNTMNLGHMANAINAFKKTGKMTAFDPPAIQSTGLPYGPLPVSWYTRVDEANPAGEPSVSTIGKQLTTIWDDSRAPVVTTSGDTSASAVQPSGDAPRVSQASTLSSAPSGSATETH